jgi:signal peptidase I
VTAVAPVPAPAPAQARPAPAVPKDSWREVVETIVFVVVLVLLLKSFAAEAFVIPTGSMATTLLGYHKNVTCPQCGHHFPVNCSKEVDAQEKDLQPILGCVCPNCRYHINFADEHMSLSWSSGDRVLVAKFLNDSGLLDFQRHDVVVFKFPERPQKDHVPTNYIKRLIGLPGETIIIYYGKLYRLTNVQWDDAVRTDPKELWRKQYMRAAERRPDDGNDPDGTDLIRRYFPGAQIIRKPPDKLLALLRLVYDNDHPARDLEDILPPRWDGGPAWKADKEAHGFATDGQGPEVAWLRYRHILRPWPGSREDPKPQLITDFTGYNTYMLVRDDPHRDPAQEEFHHRLAQNWVGDLMLDGKFTIKKSEGQLWLELSKGIDRFRASWDLATGTWTLYREGPQELAKGQPQQLASKQGRVPKPGDYHIRFANVDERLTLWVGNDLVFGDGVPYDPPEERGPQRNDLEPASVGSRGAAVEVHQLKLWRDTYYTTQIDGPRPDAGVDEVNKPGLWSNPDEWQPLRRLPTLSLYVQPGHYLCLGDNSPESSDGRAWGLVPERLMLGRALLVYYPFNRAGRIK